jgi:hypothetical protein
MKLDEAWKYLEDTGEPTEAIRVIRASHDKLVAALREIEKCPWEKVYLARGIAQSALADLTEEQEP